MLESFAGHLKFTLASFTDHNLSSFFELFERNKNRLEITQYSISQTSLEQVFIRFAKMQEE